MKTKLWMFLVSLASAFLLWLYVISVVSPGSTETFYNIPVVMQGEGALEGRNLIIMKGGSPTVELELSGNRTDLQELNSYNITVIADLSKIYDAGEHSLQYDISYPGNIASNAIEELSRSPGTLDIYVEWVIEKEVPINVNWTGVVPATHIAYREERVLTFNEVVSEKITVRGPSSVIEKIDRAEITVDLEGKTGHISEDHRFILVDANGIEVDDENLVTTVNGNKVSQVNLEMDILERLEIPLLVEVIDGGGATAETASIRILTTGTLPREITSVTVAGMPSALELINLETPILTVNLAEYPVDETVLVPLTIIPATVKNVSQITEVQVEIKFSDLLTKEIKLHEISALNIPERMEATLDTQELTVQVRGPSALVEEITAEDLTVTVDLALQAPGSFTILPTITIAPEYAQVGILGDVASVSGTLVELPPVEEFSDDPAGEG